MAESGSMALAHPRSMTERGIPKTTAVSFDSAMTWPPGEAAVRALNAGNDLLLKPPDITAARVGILAALATEDMNRAVQLADRFANEAARVSAVIAVARSVLVKKS